MNEQLIKDQEFLKNFLKKYGFIDEIMEFGKKIENALFIMQNRLDEIEHLESRLKTLEDKQK